MLAMAHWPKCPICVGQKTPNYFSSLCYLTELSILIGCYTHNKFFYRNFPLPLIWLILGKNGWEEFPKENMNGYNISCTCSTVIFQIKQKMKGWTCGQSIQALPHRFLSLYFLHSRNSVRDWLVGLSPAFYWWQWKLMHTQSNQMSCHTFVPFSGERTQESLVTVSRLLLQLKPVHQSLFELLSLSVRQQSWFTAKLMFLCTTDFPTPQSSQSYLFQFVFGEVFLFVLHLGAVFSDSYHLLIQFHT